MLVLETAEYVFNIVRGGGSLLGRRQRPICRHVVVLQYQPITLQYYITAKHTLWALPITRTCWLCPLVE